MVHSMWKHKKWFNQAIIVILLVTMIFPASLSVGNVKQAAAAAAPAVANHVVISQFYIGNGTSTFKNRYVELYNPTNSPVDLSTWSFQNASATGAFSTITKLTGSIAAYGYYLIQCAAQSNTVGLDLPTPNVVSASGVNFGAAGAKIALVSKQTAITGSTDTAVVDFIGYGTATDFWSKVAIANPSVATMAYFRKTNSGLQPDISGDGNGLDSKNNNVDFVFATPFPRNTSFPNGSGNNLGDVSIDVLHANDTNGLPTSLGKGVTVSGVVTVGNKVLGTDNTNFYIQDSTGGINVVSSAAPSAAIIPGHKLQISGTVGVYKGITQVIAGTIIDQGLDTTPASKEINIVDLKEGSAAAESLEGRLVKLSAKVTNIPTIGTDINVTVSDEAGNTGIVKIMGSTRIDLSTALVKDETFTFTGIVGQYQDLLPFTKGYNIMPRSASDIRGALSIQHDPLPRAYPGIDLPFAATIKNADSAILYYKSAEASSYQAINMVAADGSTSYNGKILEQDVPKTSLMYYIEATGDGKTLKTPVYTVEVTNDTEGPTFLNELPGAGQQIETKHPIISVQMSDLSGVNASTAKIFIDGADSSHEFSKRAEITEGLIKLTLTPADDLSEGPHTIRVEAKDKLGNSSFREWTFMVAPRFVGGNHYRGTTHNHTNISHDAAGSPEDALKAAENYDYDFFAFSDHSHDIDSSLVGKDSVDHKGMMERTGGSDWKLTKDLAKQYTKDGSFVVFPAFEMTSTTWGHSNVFGTTNFIDRVEEKGQYQNLQNYYAWILSYDDIVAQFNHPAMSANAFDNFIPYNKNVDKLFTMLEVGNGSGHYGYANAEDKFFNALDLGWHVAPTYGEDNHDATWGQTKNRTIIVAEDLTQNSLLDAMKKMRVYFTEDPNAEMDVMASGWYMGSTVDTKNLNFDINVRDKVLEKATDPKYSYIKKASNDDIAKAELITNGASVVDTYIPTENSPNLHWKPTVNVAGGQQWFVVRITQKDGDRIYSAPIWSPEDDLSIKIGSVTASDGSITGDVPTTLTASISNPGKINVTNLNASFYYDDVTIGNKIGEATIDSLAVGKTAVAQVEWTKPIAGTHNVIVVLTAGDGNDLGDNHFKQKFDIKPSLGIKIMIDASHQNENTTLDTGSYKNNLQTFTSMMRKNGYTVLENSTTLTAASLAGIKVLMITHPASTYSTAEINAIKTFIADGGSIYAAENSNNQLLNNLLSGVGSSILMNKDTIYDDSRAGNFWSTIAGKEFAVRVHPTPLNNYLTDFVTDLDYYLGGSLVKNNGSDGKVPLTDSDKVTIIARGNETTYQQSAPSGGVSYKVGSGASGGSQIPLVAAEQLGAGRVIVSGMNILNDQQLKVDATSPNTNIQFTNNVINWLANREPKVITIGEARNLTADTEVVVQGKVTTAAGVFYDAFYVQDSTGGIMAFSEVPEGSLKVGDTVRAYGHIKVFENNLELEFDKFANSIVKINSGSPVQPKEVTTGDATLEQNQGQLVKIFGTVTAIPDDSSYMINDGTGDVLLFVDGYIANQSGVPLPKLAIGEKLSAIGLTGKYAEGTRIRVRDTSELIPTDSLNPVTNVSLNESSVTLSPGDANYTLVAAVQPANATDKKVTWTSSNESVVKVTNGVVSVVGLGTATVAVVTLDGGYHASAVVNVIPVQPNVKADVAAKVIVGIDSTMEYNINGADTWTTYNAANPPNLNGELTVQVRVKANGNVLAGQIRTLFFNTAAPILTGFTWAKGSTLGTSATALPAGTLKYTVGAAGALPNPAINEPATAYTKFLTLNTDIFVNANQHIFIVSVDSNNKIIGWADSTVAAANVLTPVTVAKWDFTGSVATATDGNIANKGVKSVAVVGAASFTFTATGGVSSSAAVTSSGWDAVPAYWMVPVDTTGYSYIQVSSRQYSSGSGPKDFKLQYSLNGSSWLDVPDGSIVVGNASWTTGGVLSNATLPTAANNQSNVLVRWLVASTNPADATKVFGSGGTNRLDDVVITGIPLVSAPNVSADDVLKTITGIDGTMEYNINNTGWITYNASNPPDLNGNYSVQIRKGAKGDVLPGLIKTLTFTPLPDSPAPPNVTANDLLDIIIGIDETMEYMIDFGDWIPYDHLSLPDLSGNHIVKVRVKANDPVPAGQITTLYFTAKQVTALDIAMGITSITAPLQDVTSLTLPLVPAGYTVAIKSSDNVAVIKTDGTVIPPSSATTVLLVLEVTRTSDGTTAETNVISVVVPAKTVIAPTAAEIAAGIISITAPLQDVTSLTLPSLPIGYTVAIKNSDNEAVIKTDGTVIPPSSATTVQLVLEVTRTSDNTTAETIAISVVVPAKSVIAPTAEEVAAGIVSIEDPLQDVTSLTLPVMPVGYTVAIKSSDNEAVIKTDGTVIPPSSTTTVELVLVVTRTSDNTTADTIAISVVVPAKTVVAPTAAEIAAGIISITAPSKDAVSLTLPIVPTGYTVAIKSSNNEAVIKTDGTVIPPSSATTVELVLEVTRTSDNTTADTIVISVVVPAQSVVAPTAAEIAAGIISITAPTKDAVSLTLPIVPTGYTVAIKSSNNEAVIKTDGTIIPPSSATTVQLVLEVTRTSDSTTADTIAISVMVPAKSVSVIVPPGGSGGNTDGGTGGKNEEKPTTVVVTTDKLISTVNGKSIVEVPSKTTEVILPSNITELLRNNTLEIKSNDITLNVPVDLIKQLQSKLSADDLKDSVISLKFEPLTTSDTKAILAKGSASSNSSIKVGGEVYEFSFTITTTSGKTEKLTNFDQPITISLKVDPSMNPQLSGIFYISDDGKLEYIGGKYSSGEIVAQINHFSKYAVLEVKKNFNDLTTKHWAYNVIEELAMKQLVNGTSDSTFEPDRLVTRAEFTLMLVNALKLTATSEHKFTDVAADKWYAEAISIAYKAGIVKGKSATTFDPNGRITREEMVAMMMNAYKLLNNKSSANVQVTFTDESKISSWALDNVKEAAALDLIHGRAAGLFVPKGVTTRAEAAQVIYSLIRL